MDLKKCGVGQWCGKEQRLALRDEGTWWAGSRPHRPMRIVLGSVCLTENRRSYRDRTSTWNLPALFANGIPTM